jgi:Ca2+-binding RTX toxin-like protein
MGGGKASFMATALTAAAILLFAAASASAATVSLQETPGNTNEVLLAYQADPGENNHLTITAVGKSNPTWELHVVDPDAAITVGSGCSGGGSKGTEATCTMHEPKGFDFGTCEGHDCIPPTIPGTAWKVHWAIALGDGENYFDGSAFTGIYEKSITMTVSSGSGKDWISTGGGNDVIDPGAGSDQVRGGEGADMVETTAVADGPDFYEVGEVSYRNRTEPVYLEGETAGATGENDKLVGVLDVIGGTADDVLVGTSSAYTLEGGPGDDTLVGTNPRSNELYGGTGNDQLSSVPAGAESINHLIGEEGNDSYYGGTGIDMMRDANGSASGYGPPPGPSGGNDIAYGGEGNDYIELRAGEDTANGGPGNDGLHGGVGEDRLFGGAGEDFVIGGSGHDRLYGGSGHDLLFSGWWTWNFPNSKNSFPFPTVHNDGPDRVDCGPGRDHAFSNPWDQLLRCESRTLQPH